MTVGKEHVTTGYMTSNFDGQVVRVGFDRLGEGRTVLLLPAFSSISTRREMRPLQERLASEFATVAIDWPGFGDQPRPRIAWAPPVYTAFLEHVLRDVAPRPFATVAAGHAAGYALRAAAEGPVPAGRLCLIAPTWRGPLPTMMDGGRRLGNWIARAGDLPVLGALLYRINVNAPVVRMMARGHVYSDRNWLEGERLGQKMAVVAAPGARHASIRFVTGMLDPMPDRRSFLDTAERVNEPILIVYGASTPRKSKAEMEALASIPHVRSVELPRGKLAIHEEFPDAVADVVRSFLGCTAAAVERLVSDVDGEVTQPLRLA
ncbi:MAG: alpha/beta fold hydrolase [Geminicoccaceae bacterium]